MGTDGRDEAKRRFSFIMRTCPIKYMQAMQYYFKFFFLWLDSPSGPMALHR